MLQIKKPEIRKIEFECMETSSDFSLFRKNLGIEYKKKIKKLLKT